MEVGGGWGKLLDDRPPTASLLEVQKYVQERLEKQWLPLFLATPEFAERQQAQSGGGDVEDTQVQKKKKLPIWKVHVFMIHNQIIQQTFVFNSFKTF